MESHERLHSEELLHFFMMKRIKQENKHYFEYMQRHFLRYCIHFGLESILKITTNFLHDAHDCAILRYILSVKFLYTVSSSSVWPFPTERWTQRNLMLHLLSFLLDMFPTYLHFFYLTIFMKSFDLILSFMLFLFTLIHITLEDLSIC